MAIIPIPESREEWLALRRNYIGGSEVASLLGMAAGWGLSPRALFHIKRGEHEEPNVDTERTRRGNSLEQDVADDACRLEGWRQEPGVFAIDDTTPGMAATLDRIIHPSEQDIRDGLTGPGALECKVVGAKIFRDTWLDDEPPEHILIQHQQQLACADFKWGAIGAYVVNDYTGEVERVYRRRYTRHEPTIALVRDAVTDFWRRVRENDPPPVDGSESTAKALRSLHPETDGRTIDLTAKNYLAEKAARYVAIGKMRREIEKEEEEIRNLFREEIGSARYALVAGGIKISHSIGTPSEPKPPPPGYMIPGRKGQERFTVTLPKETTK